jgi:type IV pilus assembly protein PilE
MTTLSRGFTLIEIMIVVAIVAILAAIAMPAYSDYITRGKVLDATNGLQSVRTQLEQYYQDNRSYQNANASITSPCTNVATLTASIKDFVFTCTAPTSTTYTITATGSATDGNTKNFIYTLDQNGTPATLSTPARWGSATSSACFIVKKGTTC